MPYVAMKLEDVPIVIVRITGRLTPEVHFRYSLDVADLIKDIQGPVYRVNDLTGVSVTLLDLIEIIGQAAKGWAGTGSDPRVQTITVFDHPNFGLGLADVLRRFEWGRRIRRFNTLSEALEYARAQVGGPAAEHLDQARQDHPVI